MRAAVHIFSERRRSPLEAAQVDAIVGWTLRNIRSGAGGSQTAASAAADWEEDPIPLQSRVAPAIQPEWIPGPLGGMAAATAMATETPSRPGDLHPEPLTDSGREPLDSSGSCHRMKAAAFRQNQSVPPVSG